MHYVVDCTYVKCKAKKYGGACLPEWKSVITFYAIVNTHFLLILAINCILLDKSNKNIHSLLSDCMKGV